MMVMQDKSQAKFLWFELMKCKKICIKHDEFWHTWATNEKKQTLENLQILEKSKKITKELKKTIKVRPKKIQKPLVSDAERRKHRSKTERLRRARLRKTNPIWHEIQKQKQKDYYKKNPEIQIASSTKWNQANKDRKNANNRASYARNADRINRERRLARKQKHG